MKTFLPGLLVAGALSAMGLTAAHAEQSPRTFAIMSLIGDTVTASPYFGTADGQSVRVNGRTNAQSTVTGGRIPKIADTIIPNPGIPIDDMTERDIAAIVKQRMPEAVLDMLVTRDTRLYQLQGDLFDGGDKNRAVKDALQATLKEHKATHLILITKRRSPIEMLGDPAMFNELQVRLLRGSSGDVRRLEGIGFYVDDAVSLQNQKTLEYSRGFLAAFINATVWLVDARTMQVVDKVNISKANVIAISRPLEVGFNAWDEASDKQKFEALLKLIDKSTSEAMPKLLAGSV